MTRYYTPMTEEQIDLAAEIVATRNRTITDRDRTIASQAEVIAKMREALAETTAEAIEHRTNIIEVRNADFRGLADLRYQQTYDQEIARFDALIGRARAALALAEAK